MCVCACYYLQQKNLKKLKEKFSMCIVDKTYKNEHEEVIGEWKSREKEEKNGNYENPQERRFRKMSFGNLRRVHHTMPSSCPSSSIFTINAHSPHPTIIPLFIETSLLVAVVVVVMCCRGLFSEEIKKKLNSMLACNQSIYMIKRFSLNFLFIHHHSPIFPIVAFYIVKRERECAKLAY